MSEPRDYGANQSLIVSASLGEVMILAAIGDAANREIEGGGRDVGDHPIDQKGVTHSGLFVWEGDIKYDDEWIDWRGTWRPARVGDMERFGLRGLEPAVPDEPQWLILSLKWSRSSRELIWYGPNGSGYTTDLNHAGRYSADEAAIHEEEGVTLAVREDVALRDVQPCRFVEASFDAVERFKAARKAELDARNATPTGGSAVGGQEGGQS